MIRRLTLGIGIAAGAASGVGWTITRRLTAPVSPRAFDLTIRDIEHDNDGDLIVLDRTDQTTADGTYNLWFEHGGWAQLSADVRDRGPARVARRITGTALGLAPKAGDRASWSGIYYAAPHEAGLDARNITITTPTGQCPAWRIDGDPSTWAIHIHGLAAQPAPAPSAASSQEPTSATPPSSLLTATPKRAPASGPADPPSATPKRRMLTRPSGTPSDEALDGSCSSAGQWVPRSLCGLPTDRDMRA